MMLLQYVRREVNKIQIYSKEAVVNLRALAIRNEELKFVKKCLMT